MSFLNYLFVFLMCFLSLSCSHSLSKRNTTKIDTSFYIETDSLFVKIPSEINFKKIPPICLENYINNVSDSLFLSVKDDSLKIEFLTLLKKNLDIEKVFIYNSVTQNYDFTEIKFEIDVDYITILENNISALYLKNQLEPIRPLFKNKIEKIDWSKISFPNLSLPCSGINIPKKASRLPNAPRSYRKGIHRGVDFFANWGTPIKAVADGVVIRADTDFIEIKPEFRNVLLKSSKKINRTPSDVFDNILLGKTIILDHGHNLVEGFRVISIYAHLSNINKNIKKGFKVKRGDIIGNSGNTGTSPSTLNKKDEAHLHWELILQNQAGEFYLGQGLEYDELYTLLNDIFQ